MGEGMQSTLQHVDDLNRRIWALMLVMTTLLQGKTPQEIPLKLQRDMEHFASDLQDIERTLKGIAGQGKFRTFFFARLNKEKVKDCMSRLDGSLDKFHVSREINNAIVQWEMATGIREGVGATKQVLKVSQETNLIVKNGLHVAEENLKTIAQLRDEFHSTSKQTLHAHHASPLSSREMPIKPRFFYGRDNIVDDIVRKLMNEEHCHIALLGTGGMGKTSVALAVMRGGGVVEKFGDRRFWVPCVEGESPTHFLGILLSCLRITRDTGDPLSDILHELKASSDPRIILLDNFETLWNLDGERSKIERILCTLADVPHITLFITMRSDEPPSCNIKWHSSIITPLEFDPARRVYNAIHPRHDLDPALGELLDELGYMPLAITLMAQLGKKSGSTPRDLLQTWRNVRTDMLHSSADPYQSINVSITLSVQSPPMMTKPEAFTLLATLAMFPAGTQSKNLARWASSIRDMPGALAALTDTSLVDRRDMTIHVHSVIRSYMLLHLPDTVKASVRDAIYHFMAKYKSEPGDPTFVNDVQELAKEETNIQSILLDAIKQDFHDDTADALITYCWYQHWTRPRLDVIESVLAVSRSSNKASYIAESLFCLGHMCSKLDYHNEAAVALVEAKDIFVAAGLKSKATQCSIKLADVYGFILNDDAYCDAIEDAQRDLWEIGDEGLIADFLLCVGCYQWYKHSYAEAKETLAKAKQIYLQLDKPMGVTHCNYWISRTHYSKGDYDEARRAGETASVEYDQLDHRDNAAEALVHLGRILKDTGSYEEAFRRTWQGVHIYQGLGGPGGIAQGLEVLGQIHTAVGQYDDARSAYKKSLETFRTIPRARIGSYEYGIALCLYGIAETYRYQKRFEDEERIIEEYEEIGIDVSNNRNWL